MTLKHISPWLGLWLVLGGFAGLALSQPGQPKGEKFALLVGVGEYDPTQFRNLPYAEADITDLAQVLRANGYAEVNTVVMTVSGKRSRFLPEAEKIRAELRLLLQDRASEDTILIALAGHGVQFKDSDENYFCPMDAKVTDKNTLISLTEVYKELEKCKAGMKLLLVDACRNDPLARVARARAVVELASVTRPQQQVPPGGVAAFFSCSEGEEAYEHDELKHGVFFHFVMEGLKGAAQGEEKEVTVDELVPFVKRRVNNFVRAKYGRRQMPELVGKVRGLVPLVTVDRPPSRDPGHDRRIAPRSEEAKEITNSIGMKLVRIEPGKFLMGSPEDEVGRGGAEGPQHEVEITKPFYLGAYPVTQEEYRQVMGTNPSWFSATGKGEDQVRLLDTRRFPVEQVSRDDAMAFCAELSRRPAERAAGRKYRLPTEAQWEYACRAGTQTAYSFGDDEESLNEYSWYGKNADHRTHPVGEKKPNGWGLFDMHGNVKQWCSDLYDEKYYKESPKRDPKGADADGPRHRVLRGGSFYDLARECRSANRAPVSDLPGGGHAWGFRVLLSSATP